MHQKRKIINDPVFGFITIPNEFIYKLIQHPFLQRLNRIRQLGLAAFVYPGAQHTRFHHSIGAMYLMDEALHQLKQKNNIITDEEYVGAPDLSFLVRHQNVQYKNYNKFYQVNSMRIRRIEKNGK